jgi:hypothetical protein
MNGMKEAWDERLDSLMEGELNSVKEDGALFCPISDTKLFKALLFVSPNVSFQRRGDKT